MDPFDPQTYGPTVSELLRDATPPPLDGGRPSAVARPRLEALVPETVCPQRSILDREMAAACCAGLWLHHSYLDESHRISQTIDTSSGSFWHGIMHRREGDYSNSKYWFRSVGEHSIFSSLCRDANLLASDTQLDEAGSFLISQSAWDPFAWIDLCAAAVQGAFSQEALCRRIQQREWELLFDYCFCHAFAP